MEFIKQPFKINRFEPVIIIAFWILLFASPLLFGRYQDSVDWEHVFVVWKNHLPLLGLYLVHRFILLPAFFFKGKKTQYFGFTLAIIITISSAIYLFGETPGPRQLPPRGIERPFENPPQDAGKKDFIHPDQPSKNNRGPIPTYANFLILAVLLVGFDLGLQISMRWTNLENEKFKLQKENVESQLAFLKNQISPHFFMNTLNNIHALVDIDSEEAKNSIIKLSNLMRHLLYDSDDNLTPIKKEVAFIKSYIELMRLRFSDKVRIEVAIPTSIPNKSIPPLLFTSLLENAFKHGISYNHASFIKIVLSFTDDFLNFKIENSNHSNKNDTSSGIGIENTKKRLDLLYKNTYQFTIIDKKETYAVNLNIPI